MYYNTCLEIHFLVGLCIKGKPFTYTCRFRVRRSSSAFIVKARISLDKMQVMFSVENIKEIAKFHYLVKTLTNKSDGIIPLGCCSHFIALIYSFICDLFKDAVPSSVDFE